MLLPPLPQYLSSRKELYYRLTTSLVDLYDFQYQLLLIAPYINIGKGGADLGISFFLPRIVGWGCA